MADEVGSVKDALDVLNEVFKLESSFPDFADIIRLSGNLASAFPLVGAILSLVKGFLPDANHEEILSRLRELSNKIDLVRLDIQELGHQLGWEITEAKYARDVNNIQGAVEYCVEIARATDDETRMAYQAKLRSLCSSEQCFQSLRFIFSGMIGNEVLQGGILDKFYNKTGGDQPKIADLATRLLQVVCGGIIVVTTYDTMVYGEKFAAAISRSLYGRLNTTVNKVQDIIDKCAIKFRDNMINDLNKFLDEGGSNEDLATRISEFISVKYDWLENYVLVYDDMVGSDLHHIIGPIAHSFHRNGKCCFVIVRYRGEPQQYSWRNDEARKIISKVLFSRGSFATPRAEEDCLLIEAALNATGIQWSYLAVITFPGRAELKLKDTLSVPIISVDQKAYLTWSNTRVTVVGATVILLLK